MTRRPRPLSREVRHAGRYGEGQVDIDDIGPDGSHALRQACEASGESGRKAAPEGKSFEKSRPIMIDVKGSMFRACEASESSPVADVKRMVSESP